MKKANLFCPRKVAFINGQMTYSPIVPNTETEVSGSMLEIEVNVLNVEDEKALVLLPELLRNNGQETALVGIHHLN